MGQINQLVTNLNNKDQDDNEQETSGMQFEEYALKLNASVFASRSKTKAKPQRRDSASSSTRTLPIGDRTWTDIEPQDYSLTDYSCRRNLSISFVMKVYFETIMERLNSGEQKIIFRIILCFCQHWSDEKWKSIMAGGGGNKKKISIVLIHHEKFFTSELS